MSRKKGYNNRCNARERHAELISPAALAEIRFDEDVVRVPRKEYDTLRDCVTLVDVLRRLTKSGGKYAACDLMADLFEEGE